jgi:hypothetical protein
MDNLAQFPQGLHDPASAEMQRWAPAEVQLCRIIGGNEGTGSPQIGVVRVRLKIAESRIWTQLAILFEPADPTGVVPNANTSTIWTCLRCYSARGELPIADVRGTSAVPEAWPLLPSLFGSLDEGISTADEMVAQLNLDVTAWPTGRIIARAKAESNLRLTHSEWQRVRSEFSLVKIDGPEVLYAYGRQR